MLLKFNLYNAVTHPIWVNTDNVIWVEETTQQALNVAVIHTTRGDIIVLDPTRNVATKIKAEM
jgi:hypothetical protein